MRRTVNLVQSALHRPLGHKTCLLATSKVKHDQFFNLQSRGFSSSVDMIQRLEPDQNQSNVSSSAPKFVPNVGFVDEQGRQYGVGPDAENITLSSSPIGTGDELAPLSHDMWSLYPKEHEATLIWLPGLGETYDTAKSLFEMLQTQGIRFVVPNPPKLVVTALGERTERAWFDILEETYSETMEEDLEGLQDSTKLLNELIEEEAILLGGRFAPLGTPIDKVIQLGSRRIFVGGFGQGGSLAIHGSMRFPYRLAGIVSFSGYFPFAKETLQLAKSSQATVNDVEVAPNNDASNNSTDISAAVNLKCPILAIHGREDPAIPISFALSTYKMAQEPPMNMRIQMRSVYNMKHYMPDTECFGMHEWIMTYVKRFPKWPVVREHVQQ